MRSLKEYSTFDADELILRKIKFEQKFRQRMLDAGISAIICPAYFHTAFKNKDEQTLFNNFDYFTLQNILHYPAGVLPVTQVLEHEQTGYTDTFNDPITKACKSTLEGSVGLPIAIQVFTPKWKDEECLAVMKIIEQNMEYKKSGVDIE